MRKHSFLKLPTVDPKTFLLLHMDGGGGSTVFVDSSMYARSISVGGNAIQSAAAVKFGPSALYCDGSGDYLLISGINPGTGAFCFEGWIRVSSIDRPNVFLSYGGSGNSRGTGFMMATNWNPGATNQYMIYDMGGVAIGSGALAAGTYRHVAVVGNGGADGSRNVKLYLDGTQVGSTLTVNYNFTGKNVYIGTNGTALTETLLGFIEDVRLTVGSQRYTGNFTPPTGPFAM